MKLKCKLQTEHGGLIVEDSDLVNPDDFNMGWRLFLLHNEFGVIALVYAENEQDAFDEIADNGMLDSYRAPDYDAVEENPEDVHNLGNDCLAYDLGDYVRMIIVKSPPFSICGLFVADGTADVYKE